MDSRDGFVLGGQATPANRSDTEACVTGLDEVGLRTGESIDAGKGYCSQLNRYVFQIPGLSDGIMHQAARNRERTLAERAANRLSNSVRSKGARAFGSLKRGDGFFRARYLYWATLERAFLGNAMAFPLKKAVRKAGCCGRRVPAGRQMPPMGRKHPGPGDPSVATAAARHGEARPAAT